MAGTNQAMNLPAISMKGECETLTPPLGKDDHAADDLEVMVALVQQTTEADDEADEGFQDLNGVMESRVKEGDVEEGSDSGISDSDWDRPAFADDSSEEGDVWCDLGCRQKCTRVTLWIVKPIAVILLLYIFICSLDSLSSAFQILGGKTAGKAFSSSALLSNPVAGLMIGILATVLVQSSSTSTSIVVTMVSSAIMDVRQAIPVIMGANIGTSVTNTIVSMMQSGDSVQLKRAFAGATVHDMFNWLAVIVFLPLEVATGYLFHLTSAMVNNLSWDSSVNMDRQMLKALTKPLTQLIVKIDKKIIEKSALGKLEDGDCATVMKQYCGSSEVWLKPLEVESLINASRQVSPNGCSRHMVNGTMPNLELANASTSDGATMFVWQQPTECSYLLYSWRDHETLAGFFLLASSLIVLCLCLVAIVKILNSSLKGQLAKVVFKLLNREFPGRLRFLTGYVAIFVGAILTMVVQSSSVFTSTLTPLVGVGVITLDRMYPLTLGSNIGTTTTGLLAAMAATGSKQKSALQVALCHMFFNISGILVFYPIPQTRLPIPLAKYMGRTTAKYRWFAAFYLVGMFLVLPGAIFGLSLAGPIAFGVVGGLSLLLLVILLVYNIVKSKGPQIVQQKLANWEEANIPKPLRSLEPLDDKLSWCRALVCTRCHNLKLNKAKPWCTKKKDYRIATLETIRLENPIYKSDKPLAGTFPEKANNPQILAMPDTSLLTNQLLGVHCEPESGYSTRRGSPGTTPSISKAPSCEKL